MTTAAAPAAPHTAPPDCTVVPPPDRPWTAADLYARATADQQHRYELVRGELRQMSPASFLHGEFEIRIIAALLRYLAEHPGIGKIRPGDTGYQLQSDPLIIRVPDVSFVATERIPTGDLPTFLPLAPDLVIEIISPSETARSIGEKVADYLQAGTRLLWLVYPDGQSVHEYRPQQPFHIYRAPDALDGRDVLPGFAYPVSDLFA